MSGASERRSVRTSCARSASSSTATCCRTSPASSTPTSSPYEMVETMRELGLFGTTIPEEYGGLGLDLTTYALIVKELSRGWISLSGVINTHFIASFMIKTFGTPEQKDELLPQMARGDVRSAFSMTEPHAGSDVQAIRTRAVRDGDEYVIRRAEDVGHERPAGRDRDAAGRDRPKGVSAPHRHDGVHRAQGAGGQRDARAHDPAAAPEARLQGRGVDGARVRRLPHARRERARRRGGHRAGLPAVHGRHRAGPRERRRPRARHRRQPPTRTRSATPRSARRSASRSPSTSRSR